MYRLANTDAPTNTETPNDTETWLIRPDQLIHLIPLPLDAQISWYGYLKVLQNHASCLTETRQNWGHVPVLAFAFEKRASASSSSLPYYASSLSLRVHRWTYPTLVSSPCLSAAWIKLASNTLLASMAKYKKVQASIGKHLRQVKRVNQVYKDYHTYTKSILHK